VRQPNQLKKLSGRFNICGSNKKMKFATKDAAHQHIFQSAHFAKWTGGLKRPADSKSLDRMRLAKGNIFITKVNSAAAGPLSASDHIEQGRLAGTIWPNETNNLALIETEIYLFQSPQFSEVLAY
jgi:hypothetical protein